MTNQQTSKEQVLEGHAAAHSLSVAMCRTLATHAPFHQSATVPELAAAFALTIDAVDKALQANGSLREVVGKMLRDVN